MHKQLSSNKQKGISVNLKGEYDLPLERRKVWNQLNNPVILEQCIKGCDRVGRNQDGSFEAEFDLGVGPFRHHISAQLQVEPSNPPEHYRLAATVDRGRIGNATGQADVLLSTHSQGTRLSYSAEITVSGWFAKLGSGLIRSAADQYMQRFFLRFVELTSNGQGQHSDAR